MFEKLRQIQADCIILYEKFPINCLYLIIYLYIIILAVHKCVYRSKTENRKITKFILRKKN